MGNPMLCSAMQVAKHWATCKVYIAHDLPCMHVPLGWMTGGSILLLRTNALLSLERSRENHSVAAMAVSARFLLRLPWLFAASEPARRALHDWDGSPWIPESIYLMRAAGLRSSQLARCRHMQAREILLCSVRGTSYQADPHPCAIATRLRLPVRFRDEE